MRPFVLLGRPGCHLCDEFLDELLQQFPQLRGRVDSANVDERPEWRAAYGVRIPVLLSATGDVLAEGRFSADRLRAVLDT